MRSFNKKNNKHLRLLILMGASSLNSIGFDHIYQCDQLLKLDISLCSISKLPILPTSLQILNINDNNLQEMKSI